MRTPDRGAVIDLDRLETFHSIVDVRSPAEFAEDHIPGSINCPVLDDVERAEIGTLYLQVSPFCARRRGAALVARNIARHLETVLADRPRDWLPLVLCWRGGQRSGAMTHVMRSIGWDAVQLPGGYKHWRAHVRERLRSLPPRLGFRVLCGPTGSGKSRLLQTLAGQGAQVLDLEALACHRGSVLGALPGQPQPGQRMFEGRLWQALAGFDPARPVYVEAESRRIGTLHIPPPLIDTMRASPCVRIEADQAARVRLLIDEYRHFLSDPAGLSAMLSRLHELHGKSRLADWDALAARGDFATLVDELLRHHYDPLYRRSSSSNFSRLGEARVLDGGALLAADFERLAQQLLDLEETADVR